MKPDDKICYCYNVSLRKLWNFARRTKPPCASQMSECLGAGTGCGWCIPILKRVHEATRPPDVEQAENIDKFMGDMTPEEYAERRQGYIKNREPKNKF